VVGGLQAQIEGSDWRVPHRVKFNHANNIWTLDYLANRLHWQHGQQFCSSSSISNMKAFYKTYFTGVRLRACLHGGRVTLAEGLP
jgi:hypothetical protein